MKKIKLVLLGLILGITAFAQIPQETMHVITSDTSVIVSGGSDEMTKYNRAHVIGLTADSAATGATAEIQIKGYCSNCLWGTINGATNASVDVANGDSTYYFVSDYNPVDSTRLKLIGIRDTIYIYSNVKYRR